MALISYAEGQQRSGRLGASIYSHNRYGAYIRAGSIPVNPSTDRQVAVRNAVRALTIAWGVDLTQDQRDAWGVYAANVVWTNKLGQSCHLSALNHYIRSNVPLLVQGDTVVDDAPTIFNLAAAEESLAVTASEATQQASVAFDNTADWAGEDDGHQYVYGGLPVNASIKFFGGPYRFMGKIDGDSVTPPTSPALMTWPWPFAEDNRLWVRTRVSRADGRLSQWAQVNFLALS